jgi:hypothetical protein
MSPALADQVAAYADAVTVRDRFDQQGVWGNLA